LGIETYPDQLEPENQDVVIWRFLNMRKFRDLMTTAELYFCRADLFPDEREGLPPEDWGKRRCHSLTTRKRRESEP